MILTLVQYRKLFFLGGGGGVGGGGGTTSGETYKTDTADVLSILYHRKVNPLSLQGKHIYYFSGKRIGRGITYILKCSVTETRTRTRGKLQT